ncbi:hypothetical protein F3K20_38155 [Streptomyces scabiei]|nr:hypothetical protein IQ61_25340 [Streptomyces scabiei]MBP5859779.1 hypothetical protein [Streptomyces sp. LBUM 1484]MBP5879965.1 hypothetical protein [Streptomyces sp. LBUM 1477]MBP5887794.1 hypothetical protein [Streptomyces sp. LBUM 1487]MBP5889628.1 hypothetical protein [Streptomyces sp. LBUM 1481]MBP5903799.1 hypothetical protein [Streptomyces sp. LBUM 1488]MBP5919651.1 hypothetical protein [Streptomyces sp. LBUM 1483]QTU49864.1 hypothetical protein F3K20_38155 [Streptomyces sp. LBUM 
MRPEFDVFGRGGDGGERMDEFLQGIPQPDDVGELALKAGFGPGIALTAFLVFVLVTSWLGTIRSTMALARRLGGTAREARVRLAEMSSTQIGVAVGLSALLVVALCGWLLGVLVIGNLITLAYTHNGHRFLELETRDAISLVDWLQWNAFTQTYVVAALAVLLVAVVHRGHPNLRFLAFLIGIPTMPWGFSIAVLSVLEVILGFFSWMGTGNYSVGAEFTWHLAFAGIIAAYLGSCLVALRAGSILGRLWITAPR